MSASSPDMVLKNFVDSYVQTYRDGNANEFPDKNDVVDVIYFGSKHLDASDSSVPGIAELISGQHPSNASPLILDLNNPKTADPTDDTTLDLYSIVYNGVNNTYEGYNNNNQPLTSTDSTSHLSDKVFQEIGTSLANHTPPISLDTHADTVPLYSGATLETVGIRDDGDSTTALDSSKYYQVFEDNSVYKLQEFVLDENSTTDDTSDDYFRQGLSF
jgi:hypothetical protein